MQSFLFERPWLIGSIGSIITILTIYGWTQSGSTAALRTGIGLFFATILAVVLNLWIVTDKESISKLVSDIALELESNELETIQKRIHPVHSDSVARGLRMLPGVKFYTVNANAIHDVEVDSKRATPRAVATMNIFVDVERQGYRGKAPRWLSVTFDKLNDQWLISDYEMREPQHAFVK